MIVGGGLSGLAVAHYLEKETGDAYEITVLESSDRLGGNIRTVHERGFLIDAGPDAWVVTKPAATELAEELGLANDLIETMAHNRRVYVLDKSGLVPMPEGLVLGIPTSVSALLGSPLLAWDAVARAALDLVVPARQWHDDDDETIANFIGRRLGPDVADRLAGPLLSGIFSGDAESLSIMATFPQLVEAEKRYGSIIRAMRAQRAARASASADEGGPRSAFVTLKNGMQDFVTTLAHKLKSTFVHKREPVREIVKGISGGFVVRTSEHERACDAVVISSPPPAAKRMLQALDPDIAARFGAFVTRSTATVFLAYPKLAVPMDLDATGFIVPRSLARPILASTWMSSKWEGRAPSGHVLIRVFVGGPNAPDIASSSDEALVTIATGELWRAMNIVHAPELSRVYRLIDKSPNPMVGHLPRMRALKAALAEHGELYLCGNGYDGTGIPDCLRNARTCAENIVRNASP